MVREDQFAWHYSTNGEYSTNTGYKLSDALVEAIEPQHNIINLVEQRQWKRIWKLKSSPKIKHFVWRASKGALAVADRVRSRGMYPNLLCPACKMQPEKVCHVLFLCPMAAQAWELAKLPTPRNGFSHSSIILNFHHLLACCDSNKTEFVMRRAFPWVLWHIWKARNSFVFEKTRQSIDSLVELAQDEADEWFIANGPVHKTNDLSQRIDPMYHKWRQPTLPFIKCNIGCSWAIANKNSGVAWIARDHWDNTVLHGRRSYSKVNSRLEAELLSLLWATENMSSLRFSHVIFEVSSRMIVDIFGSANFFRGDDTLVQNIQANLQQFAAWRVMFSPEICNTPALRIAWSVTKDQRTHSSIARGAPSWLRSVILSEKTYNGE
ncbi:putative ribonuclease H protein [Cardamine amara subsp. amara]|uniref:Ribonuclease H protein n=1 Tax=Cardamine amara subsp. amara TaxID=228776 RepID=A0ABD1BW06_CARAN